MGGIKKLLFIAPNMGSGGGEKSLLTLLTLLDYNEYEVDLFLFSRTGLFLNMLPEQVNVLPYPAEYAELLRGGKSALLSWLRRGKIGLAVSRIKYSLALRKNLPALTACQYAWKHLKRFFPATEKEYDAAIAYIEGNPIYYCADVVRAKKKLAFIHSDYSFLGLDADFDRGYFSTFDYVVAVSELCAGHMRELFPAQAEKIRVIYNIVSPALIRRGAAADGAYDDGFTGKRVLTVGRFAPPKGIDIAVRACKILADKGLEFRWYHIGTGELREQTVQLARELGVEERFVFLGEKGNPYPWLDGCDIYVQPSRFEGKSIAIDEAKILCKPILTTAYPTVADQITNGVNGLVCEIDEGAVAISLEKLLTHDELCKSFSEALAREKLGNEEEIQKFCALLDF